MCFLKALLQNPIFSAILDQRLNGTRLSSAIIANFLFNGEEKDRPAGMPAYDWRNAFNTTTQVSKLIKQVMGVSLKHLFIHNTYFCSIPRVCYKKACTFSVSHFVLDILSLVDLQEHVCGWIIKTLGMVGS